MSASVTTIEDLEKLKFDIKKELLPEINLMFKKNLFPYWIKGYESASIMLEITSSALKKRVSNGFYKEGIDFKRESHKVVLFNRDNLLKSYDKIKSDR